MNIAAVGHFASSVSLASPARESLRAISAESQLGLESPVARLAKRPGTASDTAPAEAQGAPANVADQSTLTAEQARQIQLEVAQLSGRDRAVRAHEQAHSAVGGNYAGAPSYTFKRGPDGRSYAIGGEVGIDVSTIANDPAATVRKMEQVQRAALAPADPSGQDISVAARAQALAAQARADLSTQQREAVTRAAAERKAQAAERDQAEQDSPAAKDKLSSNEQDSSAVQKSAQQDFRLTPNLQVYRRVGALPEPSALLNVVA
jgi:hypothetical protein